MHTLVTYLQRGAHTDTLANTHSHTQAKLWRTRQAANEMCAGFLSCLSSWLGQELPDCRCPLGIPLNTFICSTFEIYQKLSSYNLLFIKNLR